MSNKKIDALEEEFHIFGEIVHLVVSPPETYIVIRIDHLYGVGKMTCMPGDEFERSFGITNALRKALKHIYDQRKASSVLSKPHCRVEYDKHDLLRDYPMLTMR